jgi:membrane-bound lytic murein transglycosylase D
MKRTVYLLTFCSFLAGTAGAQSPEFPRPASLEPAVAFWTRVYTEVHTRSGFLHDPVNLSVVYETVEFRGNPSPAQRRRELDGETARYRRILEKLASGARSRLSDEEQRVLELWPKGTSNAEFARAAEQIRFQLGQSDRFLAGLVRSGRWRPHIERVLADKGLPRELAVLPHVESSFDPTAYSKVGAAGMWQFTRSTGLRYMQIDHIVDERRDPFLSTAAAAQLLKDNHSVIQSWPLALTAYNHGLGGMRRAVAQLNTRDIGVIVQKYSGRSFGFASRNFYAAFLAALDVDSNPERYFGKVALDAADDYTVFGVPDYFDSAALADALGVSLRELAALNPALMEPVWAGDKYVPKGFALRLPASVATSAAARLERVPATARYAAQRPDEYHRVRRGETLSGIAQQHRLSLAALVRMNNLSSSNFIREGQLLTLPIPAGSAPGVSLAARATTSGAGTTSDGDYVVRNGDSIDAIARRFRVDPDELLSLNAIPNKNRIYAGQSLKIPGFAPDAPAGGDVVLAANTEAAGAVDAALATADQPADELAASSVTAAVTRAAARPAVAALQPVAFVASDDADAVDEALATTAAIAADAVTADAGSGGNGDTAEPGANVLASEQARLAADSSDYSVGDDGTIEVQALETLGHYADWLEIRTQRLRDINRMPFGEAVVIGKRIKLDFASVDRAEFEQRRLAYQERLQEAFFTNYQITEIQEHVIARGESLWVLAQRTYDVPVWLLRQYNPDVNLDRVKPGTVVKFPQLQRITS